MASIVEIEPHIDIQQIRKVQAGAFLCRCGVYLILIIGATFGVVHTDGIVRFGFQFLAACILAHGTELSHQALHRTGTGSATLDRCIGMALGWPTTVSHLFYKWFHLWHHGENGTNDDAESFGYVYSQMTSHSRLMRIFGFLRHVSMVDHYVSTINHCCLALRSKLAAKLRVDAPKMTWASAIRIQNEYRMMTALYLGAIALSVAMHSHVLLHVWLVPLLLWGPTHALIELPEHWDTALRPNEDAFQNTRTITAGVFGTYFTNSNCFHVEHHRFAAIPLQRLPELHETLVRNGMKYRYLEDSYPGFYRKFFISLWLGPAKSFSGQARPTE